MELILPLAEASRRHIALVGGKAANLGEMTRIAGIQVPSGLCITTEAFAAHIAGSDRLAAAVAQIGNAPRWDAGTARRCAEIRSQIAQRPLSSALMSSLSAWLTDAGPGIAWAVRSSGTAEDLPGASFAGLHESYLDLVGADAVATAVRGCWASLFTDRAVQYRQRRRIGQPGIGMAVLVQRMVPADASGVLFTADPVTGDRTVTAIEAGAGLGAALVAGALVPQGVTLRGGQVIARAGPRRALLTDRQARQLAELGARIAAHFGCPQDIEWCLLDGAFHFVQSRPITTLFPIPQRDDDRRRVYLSVGHQQMMTDAMKPLGLSFWQMLAARPMYEAGGRLFVDITAQLASPASRAALLQAVNREPLIRSAVDDLLERKFIATLPDLDAPAPPFSAAPPSAPDPALVPVLIAQGQAAVCRARGELAGKSGDELLDAIVADLAALKRQLMAPESLQALRTGIDALWWLDDHLGEWLGARGVADVLSQSVEHNITSRMGLDLLDVADAIRPHAAAVAWLRALGDGTGLAPLGQVDGGARALAAIDGFLARYGMRGAGEIDVTRPRWREQPTALVPLILAHIDRFPHGEARRRFESGRARARAARRDVLQRLRACPDGENKAAQANAAIERLRAFIGYREYPKYTWMCRIDLHKQALLQEARRLAGRGVIECPEDIFYLRFDELREAVRRQRIDRDLIRARRAEFATHERLAPPRVLTSDGAALFGHIVRDHLPAHALAGLGVSAGTVEGRARVTHDFAAPGTAPGDILVTTYTDPGWTPLFLTVAGLVTEAGGQMSHGAVIAREYGLPAVVALQDATRRIRDGQRIRVDGTSGVVTLLTN